MKSLAQVRCLNLKRCFRALLRPIHLIYLVLFFSNHAVACNKLDLRKLTFSLMQKDDYEVIVAKLKAGDFLDTEDREIYQDYYKRALRKVLEPIEDRFENLRPFGRGEVESMDMINGLDDPATPPIPISQNEGHPYPSYRQAVDTVRLNKYNTIRINGVELSEHAKQVITDIPDEIYLKNNRDFVFDYYQKNGIEPDELNRLMRTVTLTGEGDALPIIDVKALHQECITMEEGQNALIQIHREIDGDLSDIVQRTVSEPIIIHYHDGDYYLISVNRYEMDLGEIRVLSKDSIAYPNSSPDTPLDVVHERVFRDAITKEYFEFIEHYKKKIDQITSPANQPLNAQNLNRLSHCTVILKQAGHFLHESAIKPESLFYSIFTRM